MNALPRPRRGIAARLLATVFVLPILAAACSGGSPLGGGGGDPAAVVSDALTKVAAQDINGVAALACAGQADAIKSQFDLSGQLGDSLPGVDASALASAVHIDTSGVKVGTPVVNGDAAQVPVTGSMKVTFDTEKIRPIFKQMMEAQGGAVDDRRPDRRADRHRRRQRPGRPAQRDPRPQEGKRRLEDLRDQLGPVSRPRRCFVLEHLFCFTLIR